MSDLIFLPTLPHWQFGNHWAGSRGGLRFFVNNRQVEQEDGSKRRELFTEIWDQDVCRELAQVIDSRSFDCTQEGLDAMTAWLEERYNQLGR